MATTYFCYCVPSNSLICNYLSSNNFQGLEGGVIRKASFGTGGEVPGADEPATNGVLSVTITGSKSSLLISGVDANGDITYTSLFNGDTDPRISHTVGTTGPTEKNRKLSLTVSGYDVTVTFGTDGEGYSVIPTASAIAGMINSDKDASLLFTAAAGGSGASGVGSQAMTALAGGSKDTFSYTPPPTTPYLSSEGWSGDGVIDADDSVYEMVANGTNSCTLALKKRDKSDDSAILESGDKFGVCVIGAGNCDNGRFTLDGNGEATITFTPTSEQKGESEINITGINVSYERQKTRVRFV